MSVLSKSDAAAIKLYVEASVLCSVEPHLIDQTDGAIVVTCADGDRSYDIFMHHAEMQRLHRPDPRIHWISRNGGALRLAPDSPLNKPGHSTQIDCLDDIGEAIMLKGMKVIVLYGHAPCGKAGHHGLSLHETLRLLISAKRVVLEHFPDLVARCFYHVDFGPDYEALGRRKQQLTYFLNREAWEANAERIMREHAELLSFVER
jgi:hypothetical protein